MTVPDMDEATKFFKEAFGAKIAHDGLTLADEPARRGDGRKTTRDSSRGKDCPSTDDCHRHWSSH